jgi:hypothetical protein
MKTSLFSSTALALLSTIVTVEARPQQESVITSLEYEVITQELVSTRTIPRFITLTNAAGSATASKVNHSSRDYIA